MIMQEPAEPDKTIYYVAAASLTSGPAATMKEVNLTKKTLCAFKKAAWMTFDKFKRCNFGTWEIFLQSSEDNSYSCPVFLKQYICKYILGMQIRLNVVQVPSRRRQYGSIWREKEERPPCKKYSCVVGAVKFFFSFFKIF